MMENIEALSKLVETLLQNFDEMYPEFFDSAKNSVDRAYGDQEDIDEDFVITDIAGYITNMDLTVEAMEEENKFYLKLYCDLSWHQVRVDRVIVLPPEIWKSITQEDNENAIMPAFKKWIQDKVNGIPYGGVFDYRLQSHIISHLTTSVDVVLSDRYFTDADPKRLIEWRKKLVDFVENKKYIGLGKDHQDALKEIRFAEVFLMTEELGFDVISKFYRYLHKEYSMNFSHYYGMPSFSENGESLLNEYSQKEAPTTAETKQFHDQLMLITELTDDDGPPYFCSGVEALLENGCKFKIPFAQTIEEVVALTKQSITKWVNAQTAPETRLRELSAILRQNPMDCVHIRVDDDKWEENINIILFQHAQHWTPEVLNEIKTWAIELIKDRQDLFLPRVSLKIFIIGDWHNWDLILEKEYAESIKEKLELLTDKQFDQVGYPTEIKKEASDLIEIILATNFVSEYFAALDAHVKANHPNIKIDGIVYVLDEYFEDSLKNEIPDQKSEQDSQVAMAQFLLENASGYYVSKARKQLKRLYHAGNKLAISYLDNYKEWLEDDYWFDVFDPNEIGEKLLKASPKEGKLYKERTKGTDIVVAMVDDSKEAYAQTLDYLIKAVPKAAKLADEEDDFSEHSVTIFFAEKPTFPEVPIYDDDEGDWPEYDGCFLGGLPRTPELAFFHKALEWEDLHGKVKKYADIMLKEEYRINGDAEFCSLAALPVVTALIMNDRKYFGYAKEYASGADDEHEEVQIYMIPGIIRKYGVDKESAGVMLTLAASFQNGYEYAELIPELEGFFEGYGEDDEGEDE